MPGSGKTSFLRLLLDTSLVSSRTSKEQLASVAKFVQGSSGHTTYLRSASIDINVDVDGNGQYQPLGLSLIDTPSLDFKDEIGSDRILSEIIRQVDTRFLEGLEDVSLPFSILSPLFPLFQHRLCFFCRTGEHRAATATSICQSRHRPCSLFCCSYAVSAFTGVFTFWIRTKLSRHRYRVHLHRSFPERGATAFPNLNMSLSFWSRQ